MTKELLCVIAAGLLLAPTTATSALMRIGADGFSGNQTVITYGTTQTLEPVDGMVIGGVLHNFGSTEAIIDDGPGNTNNVTIANIEGPLGRLSLRFPTLENRFGYGFALSIIAGFPNATAVELFDAADISLGTLLFDAAPDPSFTGGFVGVESSVPFSRADVRFLAPSPSTGASMRFAFDNLQFESFEAAPEPSTVALFALGLAGVLLRRGPVLRVR